MGRKKQPAKKEIIESASDITGRRKLKNAVSWSEEKYRIMVETAGAGIATVDTEGNLTYVNDRICRLTGYSREDLLSSPFADFMHEDDLPHVMEAFLIAVGGTRRSEMLEFRLFHKKGQCIWVHCNPEPIVIDGQITGFSAIIYDISDRKQMEEELREREDQLNAYLENAPDGVYMYDLEGNLLYGNRKYEELTGYRREELIDSNFRELKTTAINSLTRASEIFRDNINGKGTGPDELELVRKDGRHVPVEVNTSIVQRGGEKVVLAFIRDISAREMVEGALRDSEERFRRLSENAPDIIYRYRVTPAWGFEYVSSVIVKLSGYTPEEFYADPLFTRKIVHSEDKDKYMQHIRRPESLGKPIVLRWMHKDGHVIWAEEIDVPVYNANGELIAYEGIIRDITQRKKAEEALKESEAQYRLLSEHTIDTVWLMDMDLRIIYQSPSAQRTLGFTPQEIVEMPLEQLLTPESLQVATEVFFEEMAKLEADPDYNFKRIVALEFYRKDGTTLWAENTFSLVRDDNGKPVSILGEGRDITERLKAEEAIRESERRFKSIFEHVSDLFYMQNTVREIIYVSPQVEQVLGYTVEEVLNKRQFYITDNPLYQVADERWQSAIKTGEKQEPYALEFICKDGTKRLGEINESPLKNDKGEVIGIVGAVRDITERKRIEAALRESEEKYRIVVENALEAIVISVDDGLKFANRMAMELTGYSHDEFTSRPFIELIHPDDRQMVAERHIQRLQGIAVPQTYAFRVVCKSGDIKWAELAAVIITWEGRTATLNFLTDITDRRRLEEEQQRVEKLESIGLLAGGIAHDFNNILTAILGNISLARVDVVPGSGIHDSLEQAEKASLRAKELTQQLLTFSKGGAPVKKLASLDQILRDTAGFVLRGSNIKCQFFIPSDLWHAEIDAGQVSQVIHNLVINAQHAMPTGGTIELKAENIALTEKQSLGRGLPLKEGNYIRIAITDHGSGIPANHLDRIFDPFFTTKQKGSGLGLATSFSIARNHGGHLSVESVLGSGSTFYFYLPASVATYTPQQDRKEQIKHSGKASILVMDDEEEVRKIAGRLLKHIGYEDIEFTTDGAETVKLYKAAMESGHPFNLVILDLTIPGGMGGELTIKELLKVDPGVRAIVSSGYADEAVMADYKKYGFSGMVAKPYTLEELRQAVQDVVG
ncbi:MAG: PAS domain S-box protein [Dehalococcoidia bacterium]|jgi:PAS domain S-box-containing protein